MQIINNVTVGDQYAAATTIENVLQSNGGYFLISNADCFMQMQYNIQGQLSWTKEIHVPTGSGQIFPATSGVRFRNFAAGSNAVLSAAISESKEPSISIGSSGVATPSLGVNITTSPYAAGPPTAPTDGDIWIATNVDATGLSPANNHGTRWMFQYDAAWVTDALKWKFIGGPPIGTWSDGTWFTTSAAYAAGSAGTGSVVNYISPRQVMLQVRHDCTWTINAGVNGFFGMSFNGTQINIALVTPQVSGDGDEISVNSENNVIPAGGFIQPIYAVGGGNTITLSLRKLWLVPMRVI